MRQALQIRGRLHDEDGVSLLEVIIATFVLSVAVIGLAGVAGASLVQVRTSRDRQAATDAATSTLEAMRLEDFASIAMLDTEVAAAGLGSCEGDPTTGEPYVVTTDVANALPYETPNLGPNGNITVFTTVVWYDDPSDGDASCSATPTDIKRVRVVARWEDAGGRVKTVTQDTLVSPANRGLPFPEFRVGTPSASLNFDPSEVSSPVVKCIAHVIRNVGAVDRYDLALSRTDGAFAPVLAIDHWISANNGRSLNGAWTVRSYFEYPLQTPAPHPPSVATFPAWLVEMEDVADINGRPESSIPLPTGESGRLHVCYEPDTSVDLEEDYLFEADIHSRFDGNVFETVTHTVSTRSVSEKWYLFDTDDTQDHKRSTGGGSYKNPIYEMGPLGTLQPAVLGTTLFDYDTDVDNDGIPGIEISQGDTGKVAIWHEQVDTLTEFLGGGVDLNLWVGVEDVLERDSPSAGIYDQSYLITVQKLAKNEKSVLETWVNAQRVDIRQDFSSGVSDSEVQTVAGWDLLSARLTFSGQSSYVLEKDQFLRIEVLCASSSDQQCELAFDTATFPSHIVVETR